MWLKTIPDDDDDFNYTKLINTHYDDWTTIYIANNPVFHEHAY